MKRLTAILLLIPGASAVAVTPAAQAAPLAAHPAISMRMTASPEQFTAAGQRITYTGYVANTGDVTLDPVMVTDALPGLTGGRCSAGMLAPGTALTCVAHYVTTTADVARGRITNDATATGRSPEGVVLHALGGVSIPLAAHPVIGITKSASVPRFSAAGQVVTYRYRVRNAGSVTLHNVRVTDSKAMPVSCPASTLVPGTSMTCAARYTITAADAAAGRVANTGMVMGRTQGGVTVRARSSLTLRSSRAVPLPVTG